MPLVADREEIERQIPHRPPFLFVDEVQASDEEISGWKLFSGEEFFFAGHFPGHPVVPGVILVESMAQCGGVGTRMLGLGGPGTYLFAKLKEARFRRPVLPGETLEMKIKNLKVASNVVHQKGQGFVGGELAVEAEWIAIVGSDEGPAKGNGVESCRGQSSIWTEGKQA